METREAVFLQREGNALDLQLLLSLQSQQATNHYSDPQVELDKEPVVFLVSYLLLGRCVKSTQLSLELPRVRGQFSPMPASWHLRSAPCPPKTLLRWICLQYHQGGASGELSPRSQCLTGSTAHPCSGSQLAWFSLVSFSLAKPLSSITIFFPCSFLYNLTPKKRLRFLKKCR